MKIKMFVHVLPCKHELLYAKYYKLTDEIF